MLSLAACNQKGFPGIHDNRADVRERERVESNGDSVAANAFCSCSISLPAPSLRPFAPVLADLPSQAVSENPVASGLLFDSFPRMIALALV